ncbi:MAG: alcohol dehydrogenase catalytic domain-containing protein [Candidatus Omnitrophica bacterium]|nr:alcohol dehydrogenase catalytic domain-containing protein [Candidatus Omnitrophota bacterium]
MQVAMYYRNQDVRLEELPKPQISDDELLMKVAASGICGSDVMEWYRVKRAPLVLGHEATGEIVEIGNKVKKFKVGNRIFVSHHVPCNACRYCLSGNHTVCETLHSTNYFPGGFSEYIRVPGVNLERGTFLLPDRVSFEAGTFIEPIACVLRGQRMVGLKPNQSVLILGSGISGLLHLMLARNSGVETIVTTDINQYRLRLAQDLGAAAVINAKEDVVANFRKVNHNRLADLVIVCTSALSAFQQAIQGVDRAGTILCFAPTEQGVNLPVPINTFWRQSIKIMHSYGGGPDDIKQAIELIKSANLPLQKLVTHRLSLKETGLGFKLVSEAKDCVKVIIEPQKNS